MDRRSTDDQEDLRENFEETRKERRSKQTGQRMVRGDMILVQLKEDLVRKE